MKGKVDPKMDLILDAIVNNFKEISFIIVKFMS